MVCNCKINKRCLGEPVKDFIWRVSEHNFYVNSTSLIESIEIAYSNSYNTEYLELSWKFIKEFSKRVEEYTKLDLINLFINNQKALKLEFIEIKDGYVYFTAKSSEYVIAYNQGETPILTDNQENFMGISQGVGNLFGCSLYNTLSDRIGQILKVAVINELNKEFGYYPVLSTNFKVIKRKQPMLQEEFVRLLTKEILDKYDFEVIMKNGDTECFGTLNGEYKHKYTYKGAGVGSFFKFRKRFGNLKNLFPHKYIEIDYVVIKNLHMTIRPEELFVLTAETP